MHPNSDKINRTNAGYTWTVVVLAMIVISMTFLFGDLMKQITTIQLPTSEFHMKDATPDSWAMNNFSNMADIFVITTDQEMMKLDSKDGTTVGELLWMIGDGSLRKDGILKAKKDLILNAGNYVWEPFQKNRHVRNKLQQQSAVANMDQKSPPQFSQKAKTNLKLMAEDSGNGGNLKDEPEKEEATTNEEKYLHYRSNSSSSVCDRLEEALDLRKWAPVSYHKDISRETNSNFQSNFFDSLKEDDDAARSTIAEFNRIQKSDDPVLTESLLDVGFTTGGDYSALRFAERVVTSNSSDKPLQIAVFGNSFTIGSNCGESTVHKSHECAWPNRLARRWTELFSSSSTGGSEEVAVDWHMWQENSQGSMNVAQKLPAFIESFRSKSVTPDAILLDNSLSASVSEPWFEAIVRVFLQTYPGVVIVSIVDAMPQLLSLPYDDYEWLRSVQQHYELAAVDLPEMYRVLNESSDGAATTQQDRLWPQANYMVSARGEKMYDPDINGEAYWANFVPRVRKTKVANYPSNHPPWPTHQYVADTVAHALLRTASRGCFLMGKMKQQKQLVPRLLPKDTVASKEKIDACPICLDPLSRIDAKAPPHSNSSIVSVVCGDWKWVTDNRNRSGWQSDVPGSLIRFRVRVSATTPLISMTYMASHATFGEFRITFRTLDKSPLLECGDISNNSTTLPNLLIGGRLTEYSLSKTIIFPSQHNTNSIDGWKLLNATVLSQKQENKNDSVADYDDIDLYVENIVSHGRKRVKIQMITTC